jgi:hypothetical protein
MPMVDQDNIKLHFLIWFSVRPSWSDEPKPAPELAIRRPG